MTENRHQYHPHPHSHNATSTNQNRRISGNIGVSGDIEAHLPAELIEEYKASSKKTETREDSRFVVEIITLGFVILVALLNILQVYFTRTQFTAEQRPYLLISSAGNMSNRDPMTTIALAQTNYGKSPATHIAAAGTIFYGEGAAEKADAWFTDHNRALSDKAVSSVAVVPPFVSSDPTKPPMIVFVTPEYQPSPSDRLYAIQNDLGMIAVYRVQYRDLAGNRYQTDLCIGRMRDGTMGQCKKHNDMK